MKRNKQVKALLYMHGEETLDVVWENKLTSISNTLVTYTISPFALKRHENLTLQDSGLGNQNTIGFPYSETVSRRLADLKEDRDPKELIKHGSVTKEERRPEL
ncbi:hypothetical protein F2Q69_00054048 [Brassica cretica]|uniref:Uncharacterized protein n=1 Tax=Brassica cretica TaxID=69181 RepID=A0A8S9MZ23_BRACR|nr:hypothetical protein F2Q69_00054048 [Brassica cretica]